MSGDGVSTPPLNVNCLLSLRRWVARWQVTATVHRGRRGRPIATPSKIRFTSRPVRSGWASAASYSTPFSRAAPAQAFGRSSPLSSIQMVRLLLHCTVISRGVDAGRLTAVGFKHGRWLDTLLLQRSIGAVTD